MGRVRRSCRVLTVCLALFGSARSVVAQNVASAEVSGGYQVFDPSQDTVFSGTQGWYGELAYDWNRLLSVVGETGEGYSSREDGVTNGFSTVGVTSKVHISQFMGGVRVSARQHARAVWFGQALAGAVRVSAPSSAPGHSGDSIAPASANETTTHFGVQFGFGSNLAVLPRLGVRLGVDALHLYRQGDDTRTSPVDLGKRANVVRLTVGAVLPLGRQ